MAKKNTKKSHQTVGVHVGCYDRGPAEEMMKKQYAQLCLEMMKSGQLVIPTTPLNGSCYEIDCIQTAKHAENLWAFTLILARALATTGNIRVFPHQHII